MRSDDRGNIAIIGGGVAGLAAAFELTKPGLYAGKRVTVYQAGWRLGGKCATGRDEQHRIVEHGLHLWFGFYENAFGMLREVYDELPDTPRRFASWSDAFRPARFTQIGEVRFDKKRNFIPFVWPRRAGSPGDGRWPGLSDAVAGALKMLARFHDTMHRAGVRHSAKVSASPPHARAFDLHFGTRGALDNLEPRDAVRSAMRWWIGAGTSLSNPLHLSGVKGLLWDAADALRQHAAKSSHSRPLDVLLAETTDIAAAFIAGIIDDVVLEQTSLEELDEVDFRDWLVGNDADAQGVARSPFIRALYDTMFEYRDGDAEQPSYGAGTAAQVVLRMLGTYKGSAVWKPNAGLGEAFIAPLYQVLVARGVSFAFFHKLERIELSEDGASVKKLHFARQAEVPEDFKPTFDLDGLTCWPETPPLGLSEAGGPEDQFESRWGKRKAQADLVLTQGEHFDEAILAIPIGAFKPLGRDLGPCAELLRANPRFRAMANEIGLVPSVSVQVWSRKSLSELGWAAKSAALVGGPRLLSIWADMTHLLATEAWGEDGPKSLHYLCFVLASQAYRHPDGAAEADSKTRALAIEWFEHKARSLWPEVAGPRSKGKGGFDWSSLVRPYGGKRLDGQIVKANVDPWACCSGSAAGSTGWRLRADESGFRHLFLAGSWINTGLNTECVEAAVMSGKQASRALCGSPATVAGESFLRDSPTLFSGLRRVAR